LIISVNGDEERFIGILSIDKALKKALGRLKYHLSERKLDYR